MRLKEYQGKRLLKKYGIPTPRGKLITSIQPDSSRIAKAQVLSGQRKKRGFIKLATRKNLKFLFKHCREILLEEKLKIEKEYYLALTIDKEAKEIVILFSEEGGIEVEGSKKIVKILYSSVFGLPHKKFLPIIKSMYRLMKDYQAILVEINPLALVEGKLVALDAKIVLGDNVSYPEFKEPLTKLEKQAKRMGFFYIELDGEIAVIGNGAGLVMATLDMVSYFGGKPANFLDLGGGATKEKMEKALKIVLKKKPKVILINIFGGITRCDEVAEGLVVFKKKNKLKVQLVVRMVGTKEIEAREILAKNRINVFDSMEEVVKQAIKNVYSD